MRRAFQSRPALHAPGARAIPGATVAARPAARAHLRAEKWRAALHAWDARGGSCFLPVRVRKPDAARAGPTSLRRPGRERRGIPADTLPRGVAALPIPTPPPETQRPATARSEE